MDKFKKVIEDQIIKKIAEEVRAIWKVTEYADGFPGYNGLVSFVIIQWEKEKARNKELRVE